MRSEKMRMNQKEQHYLLMWLDALGWIKAPAEGICAITPQGIEQLRIRAEHLFNGSNGPHGT